MWLLILLTVATSWSIFYFPNLGMGHDGNHEARIFEMAAGLRDGIFPVIWSANLAYGYGMPLFEFYAPLPYLVGAIFHLIGFNLGQSVEAIILFANILTLIGSYLLAKTLFKNQWTATLVSALIMLAPYRAVDLYIRSAISEAWAIAFLTYVFLGIILLIKNIKSGTFVLAIAFACLVLSHNLTALMSMPFVIIFAIFYLFLNAESKKQAFFSFLRLSFAGVFGLALSAFYFLPALVEKNLTKINEFTLSSYYDFHQHFLYIRQFLEPWGAWEYGGSGWGPNDEMSYFLGFPQLLVLFLAGLQIFWSIIRFKKLKDKRPLFLQISLIFLIALSLFLTLLKTQKIWELFSFTAYFQFPWRLLSVALIFIGLLAGNLHRFLNQKYQKVFFFIIFVVLILFNTRYFRSEKYEDHTVSYKDYAFEIRTERSNNLYDYMPRDINFFRKVGFYLYKDPKFNSLNAPPTAIFADELISKYQANLITNKSSEKVFSVFLPENKVIVLNMAYYPGFVAQSDGKKVNVFPSANGLISLELPAGSQIVAVKLQDTPIRFYSKLISILSCLVLFGLILFHSKNCPLPVTINCCRTGLTKSV